ncbi:unnamed protein product [Rodentolepis nana]|uniref:Uncharacterized protein n=1 Tax=Rodentolepis nana TaxID=102285 RepID=A0A3P7S361_RODNA|nr:unnamed protein product [Rodentolepis nana]
MRIDFIKSSTTPATRLRTCRTVSQIFLACLSRSNASFKGSDVERGVNHREVNVSITIFLMDSSSFERLRRVTQASKFCLEERMIVCDACRVSSGLSECWLRSRRF